MPNTTGSTRLKSVTEMTDQEIITKYSELESSLCFAEKHKRLVEAEELEIVMAVLDRELSRRYRA